MNQPQLELECRTYTQYLIGQSPSEYVLSRYVDFHRQPDPRAAPSLHRFDQFLLAVSARGPFWTRLADSYANGFRKGSEVRKKLVLTLALLECAPPSFAELDQTPRGGMLGAILRLGCGALRYALALVASVIIFTPVRLRLALSRPARRRTSTERG
jgi:hypothetical protein